MKIHTKIYSFSTIKIVRVRLNTLDYNKNLVNYSNTNYYSNLKIKGTNFGIGRFGMAIST